MGERLLVSLKRIYHKYSQSCIMRMVNSIYMNGTVFGQWRADYKLKKMSRQMAYDKKPNQKIVVVFLCQNTKIWSKLEAVYEAMRRNERLEPYILVIPEESGKAPEDNLTYFYNRYQDRALDCRDGEQGKMISLRALHPQYVFYQRPYDQYLPEVQLSVNMRKHVILIMAMNFQKVQKRFLLKKNSSETFICSLQRIEGLRHLTMNE